MLRHIGAPLLLLALVGCVNSPIARSPLGRPQIRLYPDEEMALLGANAFAKIKDETPRSEDRERKRRIRCVVRALTLDLSAPGVDGPGDWEIAVFESGDANAFALPGGKIGVYAGLVDLTENQDQLATILGHEVAHVLSNHGNERVSTAYVAQSALELIDAGRRSSSSEERYLHAVLGVGAQVGVLLPFSRTQETEADLLGLDLMARAGFDPQRGVEVWRLMAERGGPQTPEFLSTHPAHATRIADLRGRMGHAQELRAQARAAGRDPECF